MPSVRFILTAAFNYPLEYSNRVKLGDARSMMEARAWLLGKKVKKKDNEKSMKAKFDAMREFWRKNPGKIWKD